MFQGLSLFLIFPSVLAQTLVLSHLPSQKWLQQTLLTQLLWTRLPVHCHSHALTLEYLTPVTSPARDRVSVLLGNSHQQANQCCHAHQHKKTCQLSKNTSWIDTAAAHSIVVNTNHFLSWITPLHSAYLCKMMQSQLLSTHQARCHSTGKKTSREAWTVIVNLASWKKFQSMTQ